MNKNTKSKDIKSLLLSVTIVFTFVIITYASIFPWDILLESRSQSNAYAGTTESIDTTASPRVSATIRATAVRSNTPSPTDLFIDEGIDEIPSPIPSIIVNSSPTPFQFDDIFGGSGSTSQTPTPLPTFELNLPGDGNEDPVPTASEVAAIVQNNNTPLIIIGVVVGVVILLAIVGFVLLKKSRDNPPPPSFPGSMPNYPTPQQTNQESQPISNEPQYPPYINQQG